MREKISAWVQGIKEKDSRCEQQLHNRASAAPENKYTAVKSPIYIKWMYTKLLIQQNALGQRILLYLLYWYHIYSKKISQAQSMTFYHLALLCLPILTSLAVIRGEKDTYCFAQ